MHKHIISATKTVFYWRIMSKRFRISCNLVGLARKKLPKQIQPMQIQPRTSIFHDAHFTRMENDLIYLTKFGMVHAHDACTK